MALSKLSLGGGSLKRHPKIVVTVCKPNETWRWDSIIGQPNPKHNFSPWALWLH